MHTVAIVDTNLFWTLVPRPGKCKDTCLSTWIEEGHGVLAYSRQGRYSTELAQSKRRMLYLRECRQRGSAILIGARKLDCAHSKLLQVAIRSDDKHVLELALASDALVLCSGDQKLQRDFIDPQILPRVGSRSREVYPHGDSSRVRCAFLCKFECPNCTDT